VERQAVHFLAKRHSSIELEITDCLLEDGGDVFVEALTRRQSPIDSLILSGRLPFNEVNLQRY
jgi:hypothetical protein